MTKFKVEIKAMLTTKDDMSNLEAKNGLYDALDPMADDDEFMFDMRWSKLKVKKWHQFKKIARDKK